MATVIAQVSDVHIGGPHHGGASRFSEAIDAINGMTRQPDLVVISGDLTQQGTQDEVAEFHRRVQPLRAPWVAVRGNHDRGIDQFAGHRSVDLDELHLVLLDTSSDEFVAFDAEWLDEHLSGSSDRPTAIVVHHPPFETGIWWMDCVGLRGSDRLEAVVRRHAHVRHVMAGHLHRPITTSWGSCLLTVCPSTYVAVAADLDPAHDPAESNEPPMIALHAYLTDSVVSHVVPVGATSRRSSIAPTAPDFVRWAREQRAATTSRFD